MKAVFGFSLLYTVALVAYGLVVDSPLTFLYLGLTVLIFGTFLGFHRFVHFSASIWWGISLVALVNLIGGVVLLDGSPVYITASFGPLPFDKLFHAVAALVFFFVAWHTMKFWGGDSYHRGGLLVLTFLVVMGGGAVVEIAELIGTATSNVSVGDYGNNALDLVANAIGAILGWIIVVWNERGERTGQVV